MNRLIVILFVSVSIFGHSCKQAYHPDIDEAEKLLVVDGLLTDESNVITVRLGNTTPFQDQEFLPEMGATVFVSDDVGQTFNLLEKAPGIYTTTELQYEYGRIYTLSIKTRKNKYYKSSPQKLYPKSELDSVSSIVNTHTLQTTLKGKLILKTLRGLEFSTMLNTDSICSPYFRFSNTVLVEYTENVYDLSIPPVESGFFYCWKKYVPNEFFNINETGVNIINKHRHNLGFCPIDTTYFSIVYFEFNRPQAAKIIYYREIYYFVITVKKFHLNEDVYQYYKAINDQLESKNRIFDPISFQVRGNITSENDPEEPVLGVFEVSSTSMRSYSFSYFHPDKTVKFKEIEHLQMDDIPENGRSLNQYPTFWVYNH